MTALLARTRAFPLFCLLAFEFWLFVLFFVFVGLILIFLFFSFLVCRNLCRNEHRFVDVEARGVNHVFRDSKSVSMLRKPASIQCFRRGLSSGFGFLTTPFAKAFLGVGVCASRLSLFDHFGHFEAKGLSCVCRN